MSFLLTLDLPLIWGGLIAFAVVAYVLLDGFDLGIGILFLIEHDEDDRDVMINSVAPVWDGNETWLVLGGGGLFAVFPLAYATILPALYPAMIGMLLALVFRGVAFEFRFRAKDRAGRLRWDLAFFLGSAGAALCQGFALGGLLQGIHVQDRHYAGGWFDWFTPFTALCGVALIVGYALLGACWLIWRAEGRLQKRCYGHARVLGIATLLLIAGVSVWTPLLDANFNQRWFHWPGIALTSPVPILVMLIAWQFWQGLSNRSHIKPFLCALGVFLLCFVGLGISMYPYIVPPSITLWEAAAPPESQAFLLIGALFLVPIILCYTAYAYWVFRGKVKVGLHYH
jgi:cytochrome d ubiquinol oxidase subunit II